MKTRRHPAHGRENKMVGVAASRSRWSVLLRQQKSYKAAGFTEMTRFPLEARTSCL